jgi:cytochrome c
MSDLTVNKILGAGLGTALVISGLAIIVPMFFAKTPPAKPGYAIAVAAEAGGAAEVPDLPPDWGGVLPAADVAAGQTVSGKCTSCHTFDPAQPMGASAPNLNGILGRKPATSPGFGDKYSQAMKDFGAKTPVWDYEHLYEYLKNPQAYVPGTKMTFIGVKPPQDRVNLIAYLHTLSPGFPIPPPNPKPAAAPAPAAPAAAPTTAAKPATAPAAASAAAKPAG